MFQDSLREKFLQALLRERVQSGVNNFSECALIQVCCCWVDGKNFADYRGGCVWLEDLELRVNESRHYRPLVNFAVKCQPHTLTEKAAYLVGEPDDFCAAGVVGDDCAGFVVVGPNF